MQLSGAEIAVIGAGIGGLTAAIALAQRGARVRVFEQAPVLGDVGAGLQISQNAVVVLDRLGLGADLRAQGLASGGTVLCDFKAGAPIMTVPPPKVGVTYYMHRADLIALLERAALTAGVNIQCGTEVVRLDIEGSIHFKDGSRADAGLVIAEIGRAHV